MTELPDLFQRATAQFGRLVHQVGTGAWDNPTPCTEWDVRALVNHLVYEARWAPPILEGQTIEQVGNRYDGDLLGDDPSGSYDDAVAAAVTAVRAPDALDRTVHLSYGDVPGSEYVAQMTADFTVHGWDLARGSGASDEIDPDLIEFVWTMAEPRKDLLAASGLFGNPVDVADDADLQTRTLALFGRRR